MNPTQQQRVLQGVMQAADELSAASRALAGGNGGVPTVPSLYLDFLPPELRDAPRDYFAYGVEFANIPAAGGSGVQSFTVQNDSDFLITSMSAVVVDPAAQETERERRALTVRILDAGAGRELFNRAMAFPAVVGTGELPYYLPYPKFVDRASDVTTTVTNNHTTEAVLVRLTFGGFKIFDMMRGSR